MNIASGMDQVLAQLKATSDLAAGGNRSSVVAPAVSQADFGQLLKSAVDQVNTVQQTASQLSQEFVRGNQDVELHDVMISLQKANVSFQSMIQVRNRLVTAYQEIMNIQV
ncbi:flagellar hook-basal body complex protein FliE [Nitrosomonas eutropha]|uniref:Flagellar hook-basal body complex protein FliE n=1 Tax=Nitrosomonas eutropha TaxID=916 RepID=A0A1I7G940_9PROT|nr:flagellar hook-basal body complex protein FliE [Nitrosomonas eutropha]SFU44871.1 flagellar hook-basal body complex protein FliE [Nitrosomonas eutropha]